MEEFLASFSWIQLTIDITISMLSAYVFWLLTFVITGTIVIFSATVEKSAEKDPDNGSK